MKRVINNIPSLFKEGICKNLAGIEEIKKNFFVTKISS